MIPSRDIHRLIAIMAALRTPGSGCPWDLEQTFATIAPYTIEEAYEVADAIGRGDLADLKDELGDLLLQVVFHARMAEEVGRFDFGDVVLAITDKLIRRHPHVFGEVRNLTPEAVRASWGSIKASERAERHAARQAAGVLLPDDPHGETGQLDGVALALPALSRADKLQKKAALVGFDWPDTAQVLAKIHEELAETQEALASGGAAAIQDEIGDLLFAVANLARHVGVDPEEALRGTNGKFERRFRAVERGIAADGKSLAEATLEDMESHWLDAKLAER
jgi:nucleoside triphosphate diphosphatase